MEFCTKQMLNEGERSTQRRNSAQRVPRVPSKARKDSALVLVPNARFLIPDP